MHAKELFLALKRRGVTAELEKHDGYKTIDIAVTDAKVNIEVDGGHHVHNAKQALADLQRTLHSFKKAGLRYVYPIALSKIIWKMLLIISPRFYN